MGSRGLERTFAIVVGTVLVVLGIAGSLGTPIVGRPGADRHHRHRLRP